MSAQLLQNIIQRFFDSNGEPLVGGKIYSYAAGTTTAQATFTDETASTPNQNPTILDSSGGANIWITNAGYKFVIEDASGSVLRTVDSVYNTAPGSIGNNELAGAIPVSKLDLSALLSSDLPVGCIATINIQDKAVTTAKLDDAAVTFPKIDPNLDLTQFNQTCEVVFQQGKVYPQYPYSNPAILSNPNVLPNGIAGNPKYSPDGRHLCVPCASTPYFVVYRRNGPTFTKIADPDSLLPGAATDCSWSPDGQFIAFAHSGAPYVSVYKLTGEFLTRVLSPLVPTTTQANGVSWSKDGQYLSVTAPITPFLFVYKFNRASMISGLASSTALFFVQTSAQSGQLYPGMTDAGGGSFFWTIIATPDTDQIILQTISGSATAPSGTITFAGSSSAAGSITVSSAQAISLNSEYYYFGAAVSPTTSLTASGQPRFSPDGQYIACPIPLTPFFNVYEFNSSGLTLVTAPTSLPPSSGTFTEWSNDGQFLTVGSIAAPYMTIYQFNGGSFTLVTNPLNVPTAATTGAAFSPNNLYLAITFTASPYLLVYEISGTTFTAIAPPVDTPTGNAVGASFSPTAQFLTLSGQTTPYVFTYQTTGTIQSNSLLYVREVGDV